MNTAVVYQFLNCLEGGMSFELVRTQCLRDELLMDEDERSPLFNEVFDHVTIGHLVHANSEDSYGVYELDNSEDDETVIIAKSEEHAAQLFFQYHLAR